MARSTSTTSSGKASATIDLDDSVFGAEVKEHLL